MKSLKELEGEVIAAVIPMYDKVRLQEVRLLKVEDAGLWLEIPAATENALEAMGVTSSPKTIIWFLPWHQLTCIIQSWDVPAISEKVAR